MVGQLLVAVQHPDDLVGWGAEAAELVVVAEVGK